MIKHKFDKKIETLQKEFKDTHALLATAELGQPGQIDLEFWRQLQNAAKSFNQMISDLKEAQGLQSYYELMNETR